jgi:hypothetical protein
MSQMFARSKAGHDKDRVYLILEEKGEQLLLVDGKLRGLDHPKLKNRKHVQIIKDIPEEILTSCYQKEKLWDEGIKRAIKLYQQEEKN